MSRRRPIRNLGGGPGWRRRRAESPLTAHAKVRESAAFVLERTLESRAPASTFLEGALERCDPRDHGLLRELVLGTLRWLRFIDHVIVSASGRPLSRIQRALLAPLRIAVYQIFFLDRVPDHAAVNEAVEQAAGRTHAGGASFVNGVLRRIARSPRRDAWPIEEADPVVRLGILHSHPDLLVERWLRRHGESRTTAILTANNRPKPLHLLAFRDRGGRALLAEQLIDDDVGVEPSVLAPHCLTVQWGNPLSSDAYRRGAFYVQDEASQLAAIVPPPAPGERVLDVAAAPGGKTFALLADQPDAVCVASDVSLERLGTMRRNAARLGLAPLLCAADGAALPFGDRFDRVVVDLPCSGTGTLRKHPELKWRISAAEIERLADQAGSLVRGAADSVRPGGLLVVVTCSIEPEENEEVVASFLESRSDFDLRDLSADLRRPVVDHVEAPGLWRLAAGRSARRLHGPGASAGRRLRSRALPSPTLPDTARDPAEVPVAHPPASRT